MMTCAVLQIDYNAHDTDDIMNKVIETDMYL
jgi:hypothetical protein